MGIILFIDLKDNRSVRSVVTEKEGLRAILEIA